MIGSFHAIILVHAPTSQDRLHMCMGQHNTSRRTLAARSMAFMLLTVALIAGAKDNAIKEARDVAEEAVVDVAT